MSPEVCGINAMLVSMLMRKSARAIILVVAHQEDKAEVFAALSDGCSLKAENILLDVAAEMESKQMKMEQVSVDLVSVKVAPVSVSMPGRN